MLFFKKNIDEDIIEEIEDVIPEQQLFIHPSWVNLSQELRYVYQYEHFELPPIEKDSFGINGVSFQESEDKFIVTTFIRNNTDRPYCLEDILLYLVNDAKDVAAVMKLDLRLEVGKIPSKSNMPWIFAFDKIPDLKFELSQDNWNIVFKIPEPHKLEIDTEWEKVASSELQEQVKVAFDKLPPIKENGINFTGIACELSDNYTVTAEAFIRNGYYRDISLDKILLEIVDANEEIITRKLFELEDLVIPANSTTPHTFIFEPWFIMELKPDLSNWRIQISNIDLNKLLEYTTKHPTE